MNIYLDGVFDLFHVGHLRSFKYIKEHYKNCKLYIGVVCDKDVEGYKRKPIINEEQRCEIIEGIKYVDKVIFPAPLVMTEDFLKMNNIDLVVHGFISNEDRMIASKVIYDLVGNTSYGCVQTRSGDDASCALIFFSRPSAEI